MDPIEEVNAPTTPPIIASTSPCSGSKGTSVDTSMTPAFTQDLSLSPTQEMIFLLVGKLSLSYMGIAFWLLTQPFLANFKNKDILVLRTSVATSRAPICLVLTLYGEFDIFGPKLGVATLRAIFGTGSSEPPQKFGHRSFLFGQLLSQNRISQKI